MYQGRFEGDPVGFKAIIPQVKGSTFRVFAFFRSQAEIDVDPEQVGATKSKVPGEFHLSYELVDELDRYSFGRNEEGLQIFEVQEAIKVEIFDANRDE